MMDTIPVTKRIPVMAREWALFGMRWLIPIGLFLYLTGSEIRDEETWTLILGIGGASVVTNLAAAIFLLSDRWSRMGTVLALIADTILVLAGVAVTSTSLFWIGFIPVVIAGFYFDWLPGLMVGLLIAGGTFVIQYAVDSPQPPDTTLLLGLMMLVAAGPLAGLLSRDDGIKAIQRERFRERAKRVEQVARLAQEQMQLVYEMADVLNKSKLDPKRVLASAVSFGVESLERMGVPTPLYGAILLFADDDELGTVLRVARSSDIFPPGDQNVVVFGHSGVIEKVLRTSEPIICYAPDADPELVRFESLRACDTVLCVPLRSGDESYGLVVVGSAAEDAFKDTHIELMHAVANQAAASLNNVRLYVALLEERDRIVQIEKGARAQLASELHDGPTQGVAAITMRLNYVRKLIERKPESAVGELYAIEDMARRTTKEIRHMLFELRPKALDQGLLSGLEQLALKMKETYEQNVQVNMDATLDTLLDSQTTQTLFAICSEVLTNARKHAQAKLVTVNLSLREDMLILEIADNGIGFDVQQTLEEARKREGHLGLLNLQERAALIEGALHLESTPGRGTRITVVTPMETIQRRRDEEISRSLDVDHTRVVARVAGG